MVSVTGGDTSSRSNAGLLPPRRSSWTVLAYGPPYRFLVSNLKQARKKRISGKTLVPNCSPVFPFPFSPK